MLGHERLEFGEDTALGARSERPAAAARQRHHEGPFRQTLQGWHNHARMAVAEHQ